ncbi:MAG: hypothetical protein ACKOOL_08310 [Novosphingobium sp.]
MPRRAAAVLAAAALGAAPVLACVRVGVLAALYAPALGAGTRFGAVWHRKCLLLRRRTGSVSGQPAG